MGFKFLSSLSLVLGGSYAGVCPRLPLDPNLPTKMQGGPDAALKPVTPYISCNGFRGKEYLCQLTGGGPFDVLPPDLEIPVSSAEYSPLTMPVPFCYAERRARKGDTWVL